MTACRFAAYCTAAIATFGAVALAQTNPPDVPKVEVPPSGPLPNQRTELSPVLPADLLQPAGQRWLSYHGDYSGRHHAQVDQINRRNVAQLRRVWVSETNPQIRPGGPVRGPLTTARAAPAGPGRTGSGNGLAGMTAIRSIPLFHDGALFYTVGQNAYAIDARTGRQIWHYIANSSGGLSNRGLAIRGDTLYMMANGGLTALDARTGAEKWRRNIGGPVAANAPMVIRDHVYVVSGSDGGSGRSWLESRNAQSGEREWIWYVSPFPGESGAETWPSAATMAMGAGTPWQPLTYDPELNLIFVGTGNPYPMKDGRTRMGDNLYTSSIVALDADTGKRVWHFLMTPHDDHDYDGNQVTMLFDRTIKGKRRKLLGVIGRGGFVFVVDRVSGENLVSEKIFPEVNWTTHNRPNGTPEPDMHKSPQAGGVLVFPGSEGITNYPAPAYNPQTGLMYSNVVKSWSLFHTNGAESFLGDFRNSLRAFDPETGKTVWAHDYQEPYGIHARYPGVLSTAGGLIFTGDVSGNVVAFDAANGRILWHDELISAPVGNAPMSYVLDGKQHIVVASGEQLFAYALAASPVPEGMTSLLNGQDLRGWHWSRTTHHGSGGLATFEDGALYLSQNPYGQGGLLLTDKRYRNFELYLETDSPWGSNSGIFLRSTEAGGAYQIELVPVGALPTSTGALVGEALSVASARPSDLRPIWKDGWNSFRIRMTGEAPQVTIWVNGQQVLESQQPRNTKVAGETDGRIGLQLHWTSTYEPQIAGAFDMRSWKPGARIGFRNIAIRELP